MANLTGINPDGKLYNDKVIHQAYIEVNEEETEAAAVSGVSIMLYSGDLGEVFNVDHPFLFLIRDQVQVLYYS